MVPLEAEVLEHCSEAVGDEGRVHAGGVAGLLHVHDQAQVETAVTDAFEHIQRLPHAVDVEAEEVVGADLDAGTRGLVVIESEVGVAVPIPLGGLDKGEVDAVGTRRVQVHHAIVGGDVDAAHREACLVDVWRRLQVLADGEPAGAHQGQRHEQEVNQDDCLDAERAMRAPDLSVVRSHRTAKLLHFPRPAKFTALKTGQPHQNP